MRVLFLTPYLPTPPRFGGQRRLHGLMAEVARKHEVLSLSFVDPNQEPAHAAESLRETGAYCRRVVTVPNRLLEVAGAEKRARQLRSLFGFRSYEYAVNRMQAMQVALDGVLARERPDVVQVEFAQMAVYRFGRKGQGPRLCLDEHNIEYDVLRRTAGADVGLVRRAYNAVDWRKLRAEERSAWRAFDGCVVTSARDEQLMARDAPTVRTAVVPNGVDIDSFIPSDVPPEPDTVLFFGAINYYPNTDGLLFFLREGWPALKARRPGARLRIVGPKPPPSIATWPDPSVEVVGYVDDVRKEIARAAVIVAPLRIGGGTRLKVLEAMALGKAIVSTTLGAEGIDTTHERDVLIADDGEGLAAQLARVLADDALARRLGSAARKLAVDRYSWRAATDTLLQFYERIGARAA
jgi:glycosyltransferase involved in cell wall biosynthesis